MVGERFLSGHREVINAAADRVELLGEGLGLFARNLFDLRQLVQVLPAEELPKPLGASIPRRSRPARFSWAA
ncbi:hypothetical protein [Streptomyces syringium]|uniref:hypothetical protein n=1 Tax=Streptomyces syringium TaxID=76729 RepID=UPI0034534724